MFIDKVRNATTKDSAVHFEVTMRIYPSDLESYADDRKLGDMVRKAINGISHYPIEVK